jgi:hypothetical protein
LGIGFAVVFGVASTAALASAAAPAPMLPTATAPGATLPVDAPAKVPSKCDIVPMQDQVPDSNAPVLA